MNRDQAVEAAAEMLLAQLRSGREARFTADVAMRDRVMIRLDQKLRGVVLPDPPD